MHQFLDIFFQVTAEALVAILPHFCGILDSGFVTVQVGLLLDCMLE